MVRVPVTVPVAGPAAGHVAVMTPALRFGPPAALAMLALVGLTGGVDLPTLLAGAAIVALAAGLAARPRLGPPLWAALTLAVALITLECTGDAGNVGWFGLCLVAGWVAATSARAVALGFGVVCLVPLVVEQLAATDVGWGAWMAGTALSVGASIAGRENALLVVQLREAQAGLVATAAAEERNRIARELHDVIGHALTVSLLHISSARLALAEATPAELQEADDSLAQAERLSRSSLAEVRTVVGMMQGHETAAPQPRARDVEELVASFRRAGAAVDLRLIGDLTALPDTEGVVLYRIVQEALVNATRHAPGSAVTVVVRRDAAGTHVVVDNPTPEPVGAMGSRSDGAGGGGVGVSGMRQRAEAVGGTFRAGPKGSSWRVEATLP